MAKTKSRLPGDRLTPRDGGLIHASQLLGLLQSPEFPNLPDAIFVSIDLEITGRNQRVPHIRELGIATLDTRHLQNQTFLTKRLISTQQYSSWNASRDFLGCDITDFRECVFAETFKMRQEEIFEIIEKAMCVRDEKSRTGTMRQIVVVGQSVQVDLYILQRNGVDILSIAPVVEVADTFHMAFTVLGPKSPLPTTIGYSLGAILAELGYPFEKRELHVAGNDATYTLHVMLILVIRECVGRENTLSEEQKKNLELLRSGVGKEVFY